VTSLDTNGARINYRVDGSEHAPPLLMLHSLGSSLQMWDPQLPALRERLRVIRYDLRGHGGSSAPPAPYSLDELGADVLALLDALEIDLCHVCGLSLGGMLALWLAANHSERVRCAVFADTAARIGSAESWQARIDAVQTGGLAAVHETVMARFLSERFRREQPLVTKAVSDTLLATDAEGYLGCCAALRDVHLSERVATIRVASLVIVGALDESTTPAQAEALHALIPASELAVIPGAAHLANIERPEEFTRLLLAFLD